MYYLTNHLKLAAPHLIYCIYLGFVQEPSLPIHSSYFTVGYGAHYDLRLGELSATTTSSLVCRLKNATKVFWKI